MKLPRWLVIAMLTTSMLSVLAAAGWWWATWPERTAQTFVRLLEDEDIEGGEPLVRSQGGIISRLASGVLRRAVNDP